MILIRSIEIYSNEKINNITLDDTKFSNVALCGILSLYITSYGQMLRSKKSILQYKQFITDTKNRIGNFILKGNQNQIDILKQILNQIRYIEDDKMIKSYDRIDINKLSILMDSDYSDFGLSDFYIPFLMSLNNDNSNSIQIFNVNTIFIHIEGDKLQITLNRKLSEFKRENENIVLGNFLSEDRTVTPGFIDCNFQLIQNTDNYPPIREISYVCPFLNYVFSFSFTVINKISIYDLISFFKNFTLDYLPDSKTGLGIYNFTFFDFISGNFTNKKFDFKDLSILDVNLFIYFFNKNNINLNTIDFKSDEKCFNISGINLRNFFNKYANMFQVSVEALEEKEEEEDPPKKEKEEEEAPPKADLEKEEETKEEEEEAPVDEEEAPVDEEREEATTELENDPNKEENEIKEKIEDRPSPINFKLELNDQNETHEDLIYKQYAYNHIKNLMKQNVDSKLISLMKIITNQWLFLLSTKTVKTIIKNLEKIVKGENNEQG